MYMQDVYLRGELGAVNEQPDDVVTAARDARAQTQRKLVWKSGGFIP